MLSRVKGLLPGDESLADGSSRSGYATRELLRLLPRQGCVYCREESKTLDRFFFWYLHEGYAEPENVKRMERSRGFCRRHARTLLAVGASYNVASIYASLISSAVRDLRSAEDVIRVERNFERAGRTLAPTGDCPACEREVKTRDHVSFLLRTTLHETRVREVVDESSTVCLPHFLGVAGSLDWEQLDFLLGEVIEDLGARKDTDTVEGRQSLQEMIWGRARGGHGPDIAGEDTEPDVPAGVPDVPWSPTVVLLHRRIRAPGCPVCRAQRRLLGRYLEWLSVEVRERPYDAWSAALHLCRDHAWLFARHADPESVEKLARSVRDDWLADLEKLENAMREKPSKHLAVRLAGVPEQIRQAWVSNQWRRTLRAELWEELGKALRPPKRVLAGLLESVIRPYPCPACGCLDTAAHRTCDLLVRGLADPDTLDVYQESDGLCFHHLSLALGFCKDAAVAGSLVRTQRTRAEVLQWELQEYGRKQSWTLRYEPKETEQDAWRRAVSQYVGV
jgi:hypothetical protein